MWERRKRRTGIESVLRATEPSSYSWAWSLVLTSLVVLAFLANASATVASPAEIGASPRSLVQARTIRDQVNSRIGRVRAAGLVVTEATSTDVIESFTLLSESLLQTRFVPAAGGIWYALCPNHGHCPSPAQRLSRPASDYLPRRIALELALRTFLTTDAPVVAVSLPASLFTAVVVTRQELERQIGLAALASRLSRSPLLHPSASLRRVVDELTRPRTYLFLGFEPGLAGGPSWAGMPRWPVLLSSEDMAP